MGARDDVVRTAVLERAAHLVLAEVVRSSAVDLVKYLDAALSQRLLASWKLLRGVRRALFESRWNRFDDEPRASCGHRC